MTFKTKYSYDVLVGLQHGDEGKGKIVNKLMNNYDVCVRFNGGPNAGHTVWLNEEDKIVLHQIPTGILKQKMSLIGSNCVIDPTKLQIEIEYLEKNGYNVRDFLVISKCAHIITSCHIEEDSKDSKIGTTKSGIGPCYRSKVNRSGTRICDISQNNSFLGCNVVDQFEWLHNLENNTEILLEGAQGFELDIDWGDYPYVTSSSCIAGEALKCGLNPRNVRNVIGVSKIYDTYVGNKQFQPENHHILCEIQNEGLEFGSTTGRKRQCNFINLDKIIKSIIVNGVNIIYINKIDILKNVFEKTNDPHTFGYIYQNKLSFESSIHSLQDRIISVLNENTNIETIYWEESKL